MQLLVAVTGHRPNKLGGHAIETQLRLYNLAYSFMLTKQRVIGGVISGMALGWDIACATAAVELSIPLVVAIPFSGQEDLWPFEAQRRYNDTVSRASRVVVVSAGEYEPWKMQKRNEWMVDHCQSVIALWNGQPGGTANCVKYANKLRRPVRNLWEEYERGVSANSPLPL